MKRNSFLLGAASGVALIGLNDGLFSRALAQTPAGSADDRVLVVVNFQGGNDGLNTVVPFGSPAYYKYRPSLAIPQGDVLRINDAIGLNPELKPIKAMYDKGQVAVINGVGYPKPDFSHFRSTEIWQTAAPDKFLSTGWLGRYLDAADLPKDNLFNAVAISDVLPEVLVADHVDVAAIAQLNGYGLTSDRKGGVGSDEFHSFVQNTNVPFQSPYLSQVASIEDHAQRGAGRIAEARGGLLRRRERYPATPFGRSLSCWPRRSIGTKLGTRVLFVQLGSFDTHTTQEGHARPFAGGFRQRHDGVLRRTSPRTAMTAGC